MAIGSAQAHAVADMGRQIVSEVLRKRGAEVNDLRSGSQLLLNVVQPPSMRNFHIRVKTRRSGTWQASIDDGDPDPAPPAVETFWIFVDLEPGEAAFYIAPDNWVRRDIHEIHQRYLAPHAGRRKTNPDSKHHAIHKSRIKEWKDRWDLLGL